MNLIDHVTRGLGRVPEQFKESPIFNELLEIFLEEIQEVEQCLFDIVYQKAIDTAVGFQLDIIGEHVAVLRQGMDDTEYRKAIKIRKIINASQGQYETVIQLWRLLLGSPTATLTESFPAGVQLYSDVGISDFTIIDTLAEALPITVVPSLITSYSANPAFCFNGGTGDGFSSVFAPSTGGEFVGIYTPPM